jgi:hypothetical protein
VVSWRTPNTYLTAVRAGDRHLNFYETRDNLLLTGKLAYPVGGAQLSGPTTAAAAAFSGTDMVGPP